MAAKQNGASRQRKKKSRTAILVLGMHRSGTSATSRVLNLLGCDVPATLMGSSESNPKGHWESRPIFELNNQILASAGSNWQDWQAVNPDWFNSVRAEEFREKAIEVINSEFGDSRLFVLKDPRICRLLPFWADVLQEMGIEPKIVVPVRNPLEVAASLEKRNGFPSAFGQMLWLRHALDAERFSRGMPRYFFGYETLIENWAGVMDQAKEKLDVAWPRYSQQAGEEISDFLSASLRHHSVSRDAVLANPMLSIWLRDVYAKLSAWGEKGELRGDFDTFDNIESSLRAAEPAFAGIVSAGIGALGKERTLSARYAELAERAEVFEREREELNAKLIDAAGALEVAEEAKRELRHALAQTESALEQRRHETEETATALKQRETEILELREEQARNKALLAEREKIATGLKEHVHLLMGDLAKLEAKLAEREKQPAVDEAALNRKIAELSSVVAEKAKSDKINVGLKEHVELLMSDVSRLESQVEQLKSQRQNAETARRSSERVWTELEQTMAAMLADGKPAYLPRSIHVKRKMARFASTGIFDREWYLKENPDVAEAGMDPLMHYVLYGVQEGRAPNQRLKRDQG